MQDLDTTGVQKIADYVNAYRQALNDGGTDSEIVQVLVQDFQRQFLGALLGDQNGGDWLHYMLDPQGYIAEEKSRNAAAELRTEEIRLKVAKLQGKAG